MTKIIRIVQTRIITPRGVGTNRDLTGYKQGYKMRIVVGEFINARNIYSLIGWKIRTTTVV